jgi:hypothetical protein
MPAAYVMIDSVYSTLEGRRVTFDRVSCDAVSYYSACVKCIIPYAMDRPSERRVLPLRDFLRAN